MPISAAVKIDFFARKSGFDLDIRLEHVALTEEQCIEYQLPRTPIKKTETRLARFEAQYGSGATELDALEALHPGALRGILIEHIGRYYDPDLRANVEAAVERYNDELAVAKTDVEEQFAEEIAYINAQQERIAATFERVHGPAREAYDRIVRLAIARYNRALEVARADVMEMEEHLVMEAQRLLPRMKAALEDTTPEPEMFDWPEPAEVDEDDNALYDSRRGYVEQVDFYRAHRGDSDDVGLAADRVVLKTCAFPGCGRSFNGANPKRRFCSKGCTSKSFKKSLRERRGNGPSQAE